MLTLSNNRELRGDMVLKHVLRNGLIPVPESVEVTLRLDPELEPFIKEGQIIRAGRFENEYTILKQWRTTEVQEVQGNRPYGSYSFIAQLKHCYPLAFKLNRAVIKRDATFNTAYRACGSTAKTNSDLPIKEFGCFVGDTPSYAVARCLQAEAAAVVWTGNSLDFWRLDDLFRQEPTQRLSADASQDSRSAYQQRLQIPAFISTNEDGGIIAGNTNKTRHVSFINRVDERRLRNMTKVLVHTKTLKAGYAPELTAGKVLEVSGEKHVIIHAAHIAQDSGHSGVSVNSYSKFWLGHLRED